MRPYLLFLVLVSTYYVLLMTIGFKLFVISGKKLTSETSENSRSTSPSFDNGVMQFTPTGLYFLPESVKLLSPTLAESQYHGTKH